MKHGRNSMNCRAFPLVFSANQVRRDRRGPVNLAVLCFGVPADRTLVASFLLGAQRDVAQRSDPRETSLSP